MRRYENVSVGIYNVSAGLDDVTVMTSGGSQDGKRTRNGAKKGDWIKT